MYADKSRQQRLIEACNWLCEYVDGKLPDGWEITLSMSNAECSLTLTDPDGEPHHDIGSDCGISQIDEMCVYAIEAEREKIST